MLRIANFQLNVKYVYNSPIVPCYFASKRDFATDGLVLMAHRHTHTKQRKKTLHLLALSVSVVNSSDHLLK